MFALNKAMGQACIFETNKVMEVKHDYSLRSLNSFGIACKAKRYTAFHSEDELRMALPNDQAQKTLILGGGSNLLFTKDYDGNVLHNKVLGIEEVKETDTHVFVEVGGGEVWHTFVMYCVNRGLNGIENLALIPGSVGAAPMQNIGAYGVELEAIFHQLKAIHVKTGEEVVFSKSDCEFGYRSSVFKTKHKHEFVITKVTFVLSKSPVLNTSYGAIEAQLEHNAVSTIDAKAIAEAVIQIRRSKLPNPAEIGNAGSFFKNPVVEAEFANSLLEQYPKMVQYPVSSGEIKIAAGWLIDQAGWKGFRESDYGVHKNQALVLVNYGNATGTEIYRLSERIISDIKTKYGVQLEREVNIV